jgi:hypothetical protein
MADGGAPDREGGDAPNDLALGFGEQIGPAQVGRDQGYKILEAAGYGSALIRQSFAECGADFHASTSTASSASWPYLMRR